MRYFITLMTLIMPFGLFAAGENFNDGWKFDRYGSMPDGSKRVEPKADELANATFNDASWRSLDLPHDRGIEGPFRHEIEGNVGKLPWRGIGWYRKTFTLDKVTETQGVQWVGTLHRQGEKRCQNAGESARIIAGIPRCGDHHSGSLKR